MEVGLVGVAALGCHQGGAVTGSEAVGRVVETDELTTQGDPKAQSRGRRPRERMVTPAFFRIRPTVDSGTFPGYEQLWGSIAADPRSATGMLGRAATKGEVEYAGWTQKAC
jgi:hypothetical protein